jgi:hypothetical protein
VSGRCSVRLAHAAALLGVSLSASSATAPSAGDLARCAGIAAPDARLACYDTLAGRSPDRMAPTAATTPTPAAATTPSPTAAATTASARDAMPTPAVTTVPAQAAAPTGAVAAASITSAAPVLTAPAPTAPTPTGTLTPAPSLASDPRNFGLSQAQLHKAPEGPAAIQARIAKIVDNRAGLAYVVLDNGQTWILTEADEDSRLGPGDSVTIKRASLGSFLMTTQTKRSYHVRRTQ